MTEFHIKKKKNLNLFKKNNLDIKKLPNILRFINYLIIWSLLIVILILKVNKKKFWWIEQFNKISIKFKNHLISDFKITCLFLNLRTKIIASRA